MTVEGDSTLVTDPYLVSILQTSESARDATLALVDLITRLGEEQLSAELSSIGDPNGTSSPSLADSTTAREALLSRISHLRGQNRRLAHHLRHTKSATSSSRSEIDTLHLSLQNLYYESRHLAGEITACESFPHEYIQLPLCSEDEFLDKFPQWQGRSDEDIMKARIEREYDERVELEEKRKLLVARKMELVKENAKRKEELVKLDTDLEAFIEASKPIQKTFEKAY